jgi:hypothetical protein
MANVQSMTWREICSRVRGAFQEQCPKQEFRVNQFVELVHEKQSVWLH